MAEEKTTTCNCNCGRNQMKAQAGSGAVYGLGLIGALVFYIQHASNFTDGLLGVLKAIVWPAMLIYQALVVLAK